MIIKTPGQRDWLVATRAHEMRSGPELGFGLTFVVHNSR